MSQHGEDRIIKEEFCPDVGHDGSAAHGDNVEITEDRDPGKETSKLGTSVRMKFLVLVILSMTSKDTTDASTFCLKSIQKPES